MIHVGTHELELSDLKLFRSAKLEYESEIPNGMTVDHCWKSWRSGVVFRERSKGVFRFSMLVSCSIAANGYRGVSFRGGRVSFQVEIWLMASYHHQSLVPRNRVSSMCTSLVVLHL